VETVLVGAVLALILALNPPPPPPRAAPEPVKVAPEPVKAPSKRANAVPELVVVLPSADGHVGTVVVERDGERVVLNQAYASSRIAGTSGPQVVKLPEPEVRQVFANTLTALPERPLSFLLYFVRGTDALTEDSKGELGRMLEEVSRRTAPDVLVVGHTDTVGAPQKNDKLSLQRAQRVKADLVRKGIATSRVQASGRGEREPIVQTADGVDEPRNRRVEISVR
jgi:outer membrane protein OmpA-like peptidoglycan-associated protein